MRRRSILRNWFLRHKQRGGQGNGYSAITLAALTLLASGSVTSAGRMTISGTQMLDANGVPFVPRGMVAGHGELVRVGDEAESAAMGANVRRIGIRWWTPDTTGFQTDSESDADPGHLKPAYWAETLAQIQRTRAAGMKVHVFFDSNCGQGVGGGSVCDLGAGIVDFASGTPESEAKLTKYIEMIVWVVQNALGLIDSIEGLVEPAGTFTQAKYWSFAERVMDAVLPVDPAMIFYWGGYPNYQAVDIGSSLKPGWNDVGSPYRNHLVATCNILSNLATNPTQRVDRINNYIIPARIALDAPVVIQQFGTKTSEDADDGHLDATATLLDQAAGGPIGYMGWEETSVFPNSYGYKSLSNTSDPNSSRVIKTNRKTVWQAHFTGSFVNAAITLGALTSTAVGTRGHAGTLAKTLSALTAVGAGTGGGGGATTVLDLRMLGGQIDTPLDYSGLTMYQDLCKSIRNFAKDQTGLRYQEATTQIKILSLTRVSNVVSVVLREAPAVEHPEQDIATGFRLVLTCLQDPTFDADHAEITVTDQTHFTYQTTGQANATYNTVSEYDVPATVINSVRVGADGQPIENFCGVLSSVSGTATSKPDLVGTYVGTFPPGAVLPTGMTFDSAGLTWDGVSSTFALTINLTQSGQTIAMHCTGVGPGFKMPRIIRNDMDTTGATLLRPDFVTFFGRFLRVHRFMDAGRTNSNSWIKSWAKRPLVACGMGMILEDMVRFCNELGCDLWYCIPHWADDDYVTRAATYIRDNLNPELDSEIEYVNEEWNDRTFPHLMWLMTRLRKLLKGHFHGNKGESVITSVTKTGGVVTVNLNRAPPFANGTTAVFSITAGTTSGYNTPDTGAVMTVSGNSFSFSGNSGSGTATCTEATIIGDPTNPIYSWDKTKTYRELATRMHGVRTYEVAQLVSAVFGGLNGRAKMLMMNWFANTVQNGNLEDMALKYLEAQHGSTKDWLWGMGGAPYPECQSSNTTSTQVINAFRTGHAYSLDQYDLQFHRSSYLAHRYAHEHIQYEGGPDMTQVGNNGALVDAVYADPDYRNFNQELVTRSLETGVDVHVPFYTSMAGYGTPGPQTWGIARTLAADKVIGSAATTRIQGIDDVLLAAPPAYTDPNKLPGTLYYQGGSGFIDDTTGTGVNNGMRQLYSGSAQLENLFFVDPANDGADIVIKVKGGIVVGGGSNGVRVYLDDVLIGTVNLPTTTSLAAMASGGTLSTATLTLTAVSKGKHRLKIKAPSSQPDEVGVSLVQSV